MSPHQIRRTLRSAGCFNRTLPLLLLRSSRPWQNCYSTSQAVESLLRRRSAAPVVSDRSRPSAARTGPLIQQHPRRGSRSAAGRCYSTTAPADADADADMTLTNGLPRSKACRAHAKAHLKEVLTPELLEKLRRFWFKHLHTEEAFILPQKHQMGRWFFADADFDGVCVRKFRAALEAIRSSRATAQDILSIVRPFTPLQWLGLVLLLDQMPRNCYRGTESPVVFKVFDPIAREVANHAIAAGAPTHGRIRYRLAYRMWFYLPLMHSEDLALHDAAVGHYRRMKDDFEELMAEDGSAGDDDRRKCWGVLTVQRETARDLLETNCDFEMKHRDIIVEFGRYPHRNAAMDRHSTPEEKEYLKNGGETFNSGK